MVDSAKKRNLLLCVVASCLVAVFLYQRILDAYFVGEDYEWWTRVRGLDLINSFRLFLPPDLAGISLPPYFRPMVGWTVWLDTVLLGMTPVIFHLTSLIFHLINIALVSLFVYLLFKKNVFLAATSSLLFTIFPFQTEAIAWSVGGRYDLLVTTFYLAALITLIQYVESKKKLWLLVTWILFLLALFSKESAVTFPVASLVIVLILDKKKVISKLLLKYRHIFLSLILVFLFYFLLRFLALGTLNPYSLAPHLKIIALSNVFVIYLVGFLGLLFLGKFSLKSISLLLYLLIGISFLPTANTPTQLRQLYLPGVFISIMLSFLIIKLASFHLQKYKKTLRVFFWMAISCYVLLSSFYIYNQNYNWKIAGLYSKQIADQLLLLLKDMPRTIDRVFLINIPDSINGAIIYRTHLKEAVEFMVGQELLSQIILTPSPVGVSSSYSFLNARSLSLESESGFVLFHPQINSNGQAVVSNEYFTARLLDKNTLTVDFLSDFVSSKDLILIYKNGQITQVQN
ncbi:glycosyltransferase family 39 protein [Candidatus Daviesbacteria bacterium]|nr:glycosyltransferase family 39 protein [Candidatus Daviesbacteria bacterium]